MDRYTIIILVAALCSAIQRALRDDVKFAPTLAAPWRGIVVSVFGAVITPALETMLTGVPVAGVLTDGLIAILPILSNVIISLFASKAARKVSAKLAPLSLLSLVALAGCAGSFEEARIAGRAQRSAQSGGTVNLTAPPSDYCVSLDSRQSTWHAVAAGAGVLAGTAGLVSIPVDGDARTGLAVGSVALATVGAAAIVVADLASVSWARDCSEAGK
jgi:hypothetical protein